jgi:Tol biopolymer transport system component
MIMPVRTRIGICIVFSAFSLLVMMLSQTNAVQSATTTPTPSIGSAAAPKSLSKIIVLTGFGPDSGPLRGKSILSIVDTNTGTSTDLVELPDTTSIFALSPDGRLIAYSANTEAGRTLFVMSTNGTGQHRVKADQPFGTNINPSWSPDGRKLVYSSGKSLFSINIDGTDDNLIVDSPTGEPLLESAWSPDAKRIVFQVGTIRGHLYILDLDSTKASQFTDISTAAGSHPTWSPDGSKVLFSSTRDDYSRVVYLANADGSNVHAILTNAYKQQGSPVWSPDGTKIALSTREGIVVMNADGTAPHLLLSWQQRFRTSIEWGLVPSEALEKVTPFQTVVLTPSPTEMLYLTVTRVPTETLDPSGFDLSTAVTYKSPNDIFEMSVPKAWKPEPQDAFRYSFYYGPLNNPVAVLVVTVGTNTQLENLFASRFATNRELLNYFRSNLQRRAAKNSTFTDDVPVKIGKLDGLGFTFHEPDNSQQPGTDTEARVASLPGGKTVATIYRVNSSDLPKAKPAIDMMLDSLVVHSDLLPFVTPTPTSISSR